jgi:hypothetical protein
MKLRIFTIAFRVVVSNYSKITLLLPPFNKKNERPLRLLGIPV